MKDPIIGKQLANFRVERLLGQGGMATVYYGQDINLQRPVAIKVIDQRYRNDPVYTTRFINEARMMAKWRHENLIQIYYAGNEQGYLYYVMEYVDGDDLSTIMSAYAEENAQMPNEDVLRIGNAIASALDYAHSQGVIHRDVKPSNILIAKKDGRVLLGDFGMALEVSDGSMGNIFGTPHYISPEQAKRSADAVPQSDLYSLGVILYEVLTGTVPFDDLSPASIALAHITQAPPLPHILNPEISSAVENVILKALEKNPRHRYQSGAKLMSALDEAFKPAGSSSKMSLPPLPVGVPTIRQSRVPIDQITKQLAPRKKGNTIYSPIANLPATARVSKQPSKRNNWIFILPLLLLFGVGGWFLAKSGLFAPGAIATSTWVSAPPISTEPVQPTQTLTQPSAEPTQQPTASPTPTPSPIATNGLSAIKYPNGNHLTLFWNETSFYMLNRSLAERSLAGFIFERLDENNLPTDTFHGYDWETRRFKYIPSKVCVGIRIYNQTKPPHLDPSDCMLNYSSIVQPKREVHPEYFFWIQKEDSTQFRVLWLDEEVARCEINTGTCEVYIP